MLEKLDFKGRDETVIIATPFPRLPEQMARSHRLFLPYDSYSYPTFILTLFLLQEHSKNGNKYVLTLRAVTGIYTHIHSHRKNKVKQKVFKEKLCDLVQEILETTSHSRHLSRNYTKILLSFEFSLIMKIQKSMIFTGNPDFCQSSLPLALERNLFLFQVNYKNFKEFFRNCLPKGKMIYYIQETESVRLAYKLTVQS